MLFYAIESLLIEVESVMWNGVGGIKGGRIINRQHVFDDSIGTKHTY